MVHGAVEGDWLIVILYLRIFFMIVELFVLNVLEVLYNLF